MPVGAEANATTVTALYRCCDISRTIVTLLLRTITAPAEDFFESGITLLREIHLELTGD